MLFWQSPSLKYTIFSTEFSPRRTQSLSRDVRLSFCVCAIALDPEPHGLETLGTGIKLFISTASQYITILLNPKIVVYSGIIWTLT